jgi:FkbM family methyltransferase
VWPFGADVQAIYARTRHETCRYPLHDEHVLDWVPLLEAVLSTRQTFRMIALGAGWGRWLSGGAFAATQLGLRFHLTGVEAEPDHFAWMEQHMRDNDIDPSTFLLIHGAAAASDTPCWFPVASPDWYGQAIVAETRKSGATATSDETVVDGVRLRRIRSVPIDQVISGESIVDYLHLDIQGTEYEFLSQDPARLAAYVRVINIGTHSEIVERRLRSLFGQLGWELRYDVSLGSKAHISLDGERAATIEFGDGVQVWSNPSLSAS